MKSGRNTCTYDAPKTPYQRLTNADFLAPEQERRFAELYEHTNPAELTRNIVRIQQQLISISEIENPAHPQVPVSSLPLCVHS